MRIKSWVALITYVMSIVLVFVGPWSMLINLLAVGAFWALMFPRRNAKRQGYDTLRGYLADSDIVERAVLVPTMVGLAVLWLFTVPFMWVLVQGGVFGDRPKKDTIAS